MITKLWPSYIKGLKKIKNILTKRKGIVNRFEVIIKNEKIIKGVIILIICKVFLELKRIVLFKYVIERIH